MIVPVEEAARLLSQGGVVAYPTETVFGLGADALDRGALERLLELKGRDPARGLSVLVPDLCALERWLPELPEPARLLAKRYWPGPLTLVLPVADELLSAVATDFGVGFRCSSHPVAAELARRVRNPIVSTSCNRSGEEPCGTAREVQERFGEDLPVVAGPAGGPVPSTVVAIRPDGDLRCLREGAIPFEELRACAHAEGSSPGSRPETKSRVTGS